jgi:hypothetical protein
MLVRVEQGVLLAGVVQALRAGVVGRCDQMVDTVLRRRQLAGAQQQQHEQREDPACQWHEIGLDTDFVIV